MTPEIVRRISDVVKPAEYRYTSPTIVISTPRGLGDTKYLTGASRNSWSDSCFL